MTKHMGLEQRCPHCGEIMRQARFGVALSPIKARLFDLIKTQPGISMFDLERAVFGLGTQLSLRNLRAHIYQMNEALAGTDVAIRGGKLSGGYRLVRRKEEAAA